MIDTIKYYEANAQAVSGAPPAGARTGYGGRLYIAVSFDNAGGTVTPPTGITGTLLAATGGNVTDALYYVDVDVDGIAGSYGASTSAAAGNCGLTMVYVDGDGGAFVSHALTARQAGTGTVATTASVTAAGGGNVGTRFDVFTFDVNATVTDPPADMTLEEYNDGSAWEMLLYSQISFPTGTKSATFSTSEDFSTFGWHVIYEPAPSGPNITDQPDAATAVINGPNATSAVFTVDCDDAITSCTWELEDSVGAGTYSTITSGVGGFVIVNTLATGTSVLTYTPTATTHTGKRIRAKPVDAGGTTTSDAVALTVKAGVVQSAASSVTNVSGVPAAVTWTTDDARASLNRTLVTWTADGVVLKTDTFKGT